MVRGWCFFVVVVLLFVIGGVVFVAVVVVIFVGVLLSCLIELPEEQSNNVFINVLKILPEAP